MSYLDHFYFECRPEAEVIVVEDESTSTDLLLPPSGITEMCSVTPTTSSISRPSTSAANSDPESAMASKVPGDIDSLIQIFGTTLTAKQISLIYYLSDKDIERATECLLAGPDLGVILKLFRDIFRTFPRKRLQVDMEDPWGDVVAFYKGSSQFEVQLRIVCNDIPAIDTGGVRRQVLSDVLQCFARNDFFPIFDGELPRLRPRCTAEVRSSGLLRLLGIMIGHSIGQDGIGFPYLSPTCYWYLVGGEDKALQYASLDDIPADSSCVISQVNVHCVYNINYFFTL